MRSRYMERNSLGSMAVQDNLNLFMFTPVVAKYETINLLEYIFIVGK